VSLIGRDNLCELLLQRELTLSRQMNTIWTHSRTHAQRSITITMAKVVM